MSRRNGVVAGLVTIAALVAACAASAVTLDSWVKGTWACTTQLPDGSQAFEITVTDGKWTAGTGQEVTASGTWSVSPGGVSVVLPSGNSDPASTGVASGLGDATSDVPSRGSLDASWTYMDGYAGETGTGDLGIAIDGTKVTFTHRGEGSDQDPTVTVCTKK